MRNRQHTIARASKAVGIIYRSLRAEDAAAYKEIRTKALTGKDRHYFTANPQMELARSLDDWAAVCMETCDHATVGAFKGKRLVGVMSVMHRETDSPDAVYYGSAYVLPEFRKGDVTKRLAAERDHWAEEHGYTRAVFTIREGNDWLEKQVLHGAIIKEKKTAIFADGLEAPIYYLERPLFKGHGSVALEEPCRLAS